MLHNLWVKRYCPIGQYRGKGVKLTAAVTMKLTAAVTIKLTAAVTITLTAAVAIKLTATLAGTKVQPQWR